MVRLLADLEDTDASLSSALAAPRGRLRVDVPSPLASLVLIPALPAFHAQYPDIQLHLGRERPRGGHRGDQVNCVRVWRHSHQPVTHRAAMWATWPCACMPRPATCNAAGHRNTPTELEGPHHHTVGFVWARTGKPLPFAMRRGHEQVQDQGRYVCAVDDGNAYLAAGLSGPGCAVVARLHGEAASGRGHLGAAVC